MPRKTRCCPAALVLLLALFLGCAKLMDIPANTWTQVAVNDSGARRNCSFRYVPAQGFFLLWGYQGYISDEYGSPDVPQPVASEYDFVSFDPRLSRWENHFPYEKQQEWSAKLPSIYGCSSYQGITTGSYRPNLVERDGVLRPDLNIVFDQLAYDTNRGRMVYFTGGQTFAYDVAKRAWSDLKPALSPPPVLGGSLCYDPFNDQIVLAGGGHVAEMGPDGKPVGYTGVWIYDCASANWQALQGEIEPSPRMCTRLVCDTKNKLMVLFGGDSQTSYLADTWIYETATRKWRLSQAQTCPPPRAGHFTVYDPGTGWVIIGGGYNREDLTDMWAFDAKKDQWIKLSGTVPVGWYITADIVPGKGLIVLTTSTKQEGDSHSCNEIYMVRTTYAFQIQKSGLVDKAATSQAWEPMLKRPVESATDGASPDPARREAQLKRLASMPVNQWVLLDNPGRAAPMRTWGSCSFDTQRGRIVYWGGGHCGYGGIDYDFYDVAENTWINSNPVAEYPERDWDKGINQAGLTFSGAPYVRHGRKVYAYDPVSDRIINLKHIVLTGGYEPDWLKGIEPVNPDLAPPRSSYSKWGTWSSDPEKGDWEVLCTATPGLECAVTTPLGVMAVNTSWGSAGTKQEREVGVYLLDHQARAWKNLTRQRPWPQNLYEMTSLVFDTKRKQVILHGAGPERNELWTFSLATGLWKNMNPAVRAPRGTEPPGCRREAVYIPSEDVLFTCASAPRAGGGGVYVYRPAENAWYKVNIPPPPGKDAASVLGQNRAITYDPAHNLVLMVLGSRGGDLNDSMVYALRYSHAKAQIAR